MKKLRSIFFGLLRHGLLILPVFGVWLLLDHFVDRHPDPKGTPWVKEDIPPFELPQVQPGIPLDQAPVKELGDYAGRPLIVNFWGSWCTNCLAEKPYLDSLWKKREKLRLQMVGIAINDDWESVVRTGRADPAHFPILLDAEGSLAQAWNITSVPQTLVVDPRGSILYRIRGPVKATQLQELERMLTKDVLAMHGMEDSASQAAAERQRLKQKR